MDLQCQWSPLREPLGRWMGVALALAGSAGAALAGWLAVALLLLGGRRRPPPAAPGAAPARLLLLAAALGGVARALLAGFPFAAAAALAGRWVFGGGCCALFAALRLQLDGALRCAGALLAAQRAFPRLAGPSSGRVLGGVAASWALSAAWAAAPLLGWGRFGCDVSGFWCELDWRPDAGARSALNALCLLLGELAPLLLACVLSVVAVRRAKRPRDEGAVDEVEEEQLHRASLLLSGALLVSGLPSVIAHALLLSGERHLPTALRFAAPLALEMGPSAATLALLAAGRRTRAWLLCAPPGSQMKKYRRARRPLKREGARLLCAA